MPDTPAPAPPPPMTPYAPPAGYASASSGPTPVTMRLPAGMTFWDLISFLIILVGGILILVGFLLGDSGEAALSNMPPSPTTVQNDFEGFYIWTGIGAFLVILGYLCRALIFPMIAGRRKAAPAAMSPAMAAAPAAMPPAAPPAAAPMAAPATPTCPICGKPATYIAQYGRYYCYADARYL
jgi:hypothetical protein